MLEVLSVYLGDRPGLYEVLAGGRERSSRELAREAGLNERYVRERLEQQAVSGILEVEDAAADAAGRRDSLPPVHAEVLTDRESLNFMMPITRLLVSWSGRCRA